MWIVSKFYFLSFFMVLNYVIVFFFILYYLTLSKVILLEFELFNLNSISFSFIFYLDWMSLVFSFIVMFISSLILIYGKEYMMKECFRFLWLTLFFIFFMIIMIYSPSVLGVLLGWDGLGLISYCLVIYYQSKDAFNSGFITAATNRFGDSMLMLSIVWFSMSGMFTFWELGQGVEFFIIACMTKSAQFPFSAWLPAAMAAPTPISALVHSSTLVTAGIYMLIRFFWCFCHSYFLLVILFSSLITITVAGLSALQEFDIKRIVALSTLGQLGFMMMILSIGYLYISFFHLLIHALFKALLFMCSGSIIHSGMNYQDMRKLGNLMMGNTVKISLNISMFSLMGIPFTSGFYSKDSLLELVLCSYGGMGLGMFMLISALITVSYCVRVLYFLSSVNYWLIWMEPQMNFSMTIFILMLMNIFMGSFLNWMIIIDLNLICMNFFTKLMILLIIILGWIWHGVLLCNFKLKVYLMNLMFILSLTKTVSILIQYFFKSMELLDQGWLEGTLFHFKKISFLNSFWIKNLFGMSMYMVSVGMVLMLILL
uniref:NADH-ubiquinone oxidoreductase chain 5 n=1 Tax=Euphyllura phillyreae TaxID=2008460 RepID=A0A344A2B2_9HEMI|nr:NADH dehydrogenase subunit 5 [Euphyllura phillyreae]AWU48903.1 NADH dehydrogenase subunit 5 [Euphyllura phillyreae]